MNSYFSERDHRHPPSEGGRSVAVRYRSEHASGSIRIRYWAACFSEIVLTCLGRQQVMASVLWVPAMGTPCLM